MLRVSSGFPKHSKTIKGLRPRAFISFLVFGNPDETLDAIVFEILLEKGLQNTGSLSWVVKSPIFNSPELPRISEDFEFSFKT